MLPTLAFTGVGTQSNFWPTSALNLQIFCRRLAFIRDFLELNDLSFIQAAQAGSFDRGDVDKYVLAPTLRLNEAIALLRVEPLNRALSHYLVSNVAIEG
jgi:hypothetical protein